MAGGTAFELPTANFAAVVVLVLALLGLTVTLTAMAAMTREVARSMQFQRSVPAGGRLGDALVIPDDRPRAFCAGILRPGLVTMR